MHAQAGRARTSQVSVKLQSFVAGALKEFDEFAEALFGQLSVEISEEAEIESLGAKAAESLGDRVRFDELERVAEGVFTGYVQKAEEFLGTRCQGGLRLEYPELDGLKRLKAAKVFAGSEDARAFVTDLFEAVASEDQAAIAGLMERDTAKYLVYSTYAIQYISKITTTYGDYLDSVIYLNKFVLSRYPKIILYRQGEPYESRFGEVNSGYVGAVKMTVLEEMIHSAQGNLHRANAEAAAHVNTINERLAETIMGLDTDTVNVLAEHCQLQAVPDDFPFAKRANLFFFLNPDHFLIEQIGPDIMTYTHVEIDPTIERAIPDIHETYMEWLKPIQSHHSAFTTMEGMAALAVESILEGDEDFARYLGTFMGTDLSTYKIRKNMGRDFARAVYDARGRDAFSDMIREPPTTRELKEPSRYIERAVR